MYSTWMCRVELKLKLKLNEALAKNSSLSVTCHIGSHSVTCHPTQVNAPSP